MRLAFNAIDAANDHDPTQVDWKGTLVPKARLQGELATKWLTQLAPEASNAVQLAARGHHLRRWAIPRSWHPDGKLGYNRWRAAQKAALAASFLEVLAPVGVAEFTISRATALAQRVGLGSDPETQRVEDVACLVFCETDLADLLDKLGPERTLVAIERTTAKMSREAFALVLAAVPEGPARALLL